MDMQWELILQKLNSSKFYLQKFKTIYDVEKIDSVHVKNVIAQFLPDGGIPWADSVLKSTVLWLAMLGALTAARDDKHLGMDALVHVLSPNAKRVVRALAFVFAAAVSGYVAYYGYEFVLLEHESPSDINSVIPGWIVAAIFPIAFLGYSFADLEN